MKISPSSFILRKPFLSIAINKKVKFDGARCPFSTFLRLQGDHHCACAQKCVIFHFFQELSNKKKIKALRPKMTKIASRGSCLKCQKLMEIKEKRLCFRFLEEINTTWENLQSILHKSVKHSFQSTTWFVLCDQQFSWHNFFQLEQPRTKSSFFLQQFLALGALQLLAVANFSETRRVPCFWTGIYLGVNGINLAPALPLTIYWTNFFACTEATKDDYDEMLQALIALVCVSVLGSAAVFVLLAIKVSKFRRIVNR